MPDGMTAARASGNFARRGRRKPAQGWTSDTPNALISTFPARQHAHFRDFPHFRTCRPQRGTGFPGTASVVLLNKLHRVVGALSLQARLLLAGALIFTVYLPIDLYLTAQGSLASYRERSATNLGILAAIIEQGVVNELITGDYALAEDRLKVYLATGSIDAISLRVGEGSTLEVRSPPTEARYPAWFERWGNMPHTPVVRQILVGGRNYGVLTVSPKASATLEAAWDTAVAQAKLRLLLGGLLITCFVFIVRLSLRPLTQIRQRRTWMNGTAGHRLEIPAATAPEIRQAMEAFNRATAEMGDALSARVAELLSQLAAQRRAIDSSTLVIELLPDASIIYANHAFCRVSGYTDHDIRLGRLPPIECPPERRTLAQICAQIGPNLTWSGETCLRASGGKWIWLQSSVTPLLDARNQVRKFIVTSVDITRRKEAEFSLHSREAWLVRFATLTTTNAPIRARIQGVLRLTRVQRALQWIGVVHVGEGDDGVRVIACEPEHAPDNAGRARLLAALRPERDPEAPRPHWPQALRDADGTMLDVFPIDIDSSHFLALQRSLDANIEESTSETFNLLHMLAQWIRLALIQERLDAEDRRLLIEARQQQAQAEAMSHAKSLFITEASHDLRQPLFALGLYLSWLESMLPDQASPEEVRTTLRKARSAALTIDRLLNSTLDTSRLEAGVSRARMETISVAALFAQLQVQIEGEAAERDLTLRMRPSDLCVESDFALLSRIVQNLAANAVQHTHRGGVLIGARRRGDQVLIEIRDTGPGIPASNLAALFKPFTRMPTEQPDTSSGLGLGLHIAHSLAGLLGHRLEVRSTLGRGSMFRVVVPAAMPLPAPDAADAGAPDVDAISVLVVEDDPRVADGLALTLERAGAIVHMATCIDDACILSEDPALGIHVMVSDYRLAAGEDGLQAIRRVREILGDVLPAILLTGEMRDDLRDAARAGSVHVMEKPVSTSLLLHQLAALRAAARVSIAA